MNPKAILQLRSGNVHPALRRILSHIEDLTISLQDGTLIMDVKWCNPPHAMNPLLAFPSPICECFRSHSPTIAVLKDPAQLEALSQIQFASGQTAPLKILGKPAQQGAPREKETPALMIPLELLTYSRSMNHNKRLSTLSRCTFFHIMPIFSMLILLHMHPSTHPPPPPLPCVCISLVFL